MRTHAPAREAGPRSVRAPEPRAAPPPVTAESTLTRPGLLDHLSGDRLAAAWSAATAEGGVELPSRAALERAVGASLTGVRVHRGPIAASLLDRLGARAATYGRDILLAPGEDDPATLRHEAAHVAQGGAAPSLLPLGIAPAEAEAEREAERVALWGGPIRRRLACGQIHLRRLLLPESEAPGTEEAGREVEEVRPPPERVPEPPDEAEQTPEPTAVGRAADLDKPPATSPPGGQEAAPAPEAAPERAGPTLSEDTGSKAHVEEGPPPVADRQGEVRALFEQVQAEWDAEADAVSAYEVSDCPCAHIGPGEQPFARGPPLEVPEIRAETLPEDPEPEGVEGSALEQASAELDGVIARAPASREAHPPVSGPESDQERQDLARQAQASIREAVAGRAVPQIQAPSPDLSGARDVESWIEAQEPAQVRADVCGAEAAALAEVDMGEERLSPAVDPSAELDRALDALVVPELDAPALVPEPAIDRILTADRAGSLSPEEAIFVSDEALTQWTATRPGDEPTAAIDETIRKREADFTRDCDAACEARARERQQAISEVREEREAWTQEAQEHVSARTDEGRTLVAEKQAHARTLAADAQRDAGATTAEAQGKADQQWAEANKRAQARAAQAEDKSWWDQGVEWAKSALNRLISWIDGFIDAAHQAIDRMLDAASAVAHGIVDAAEDAIDGTFSLLHRGLNLIVDNLPGELGEIGREHRESMHALLDSAQSTLDGWGVDLHARIDTGIEGLREDFHGTLEEWRQDVHDLAEVATNFLENPGNTLLSLLRGVAPELAALAESGLDGLVGQAAEGLAGALEGLIARTGLDTITEGLQSLHAEQFCAAGGPAETAGDSCEALKEKLGDLQRRFTALLDSSFAQDLRAAFVDNTARSDLLTAGTFTSFLAFIKIANAPAWAIWQGLSRAAARLSEVLGPNLQAAWAVLATKLGIDPNLSPLEALQQGLEGLWSRVYDAIRPLVEGAQSITRWLRYDTFFTPLIDLMGRLPELWGSFKEYVGSGIMGAGSWIAENAEALYNGVLPPLRAVVGFAADVADKAAQGAATWGPAILSAVDGALSWAAELPVVGHLMEVVARLLGPHRALLEIWITCGTLALQSHARLLAWLRDHAEVILDICAGLIVMMAGFPASVIPFLAGNIWLYLMPACWKAPIIDFLLDLALKLWRFLPPPTDLLAAAMHGGMIGFLEAVKEAPEPQKIKAFDLFAKLTAGNVQLLAGFVVGLGQGIWDATIGTVVFLIDLAVWIPALPVKLADWGFALSAASQPGAAAAPGAPAAEGEAAAEGSLEEEPRLDAPAAPGGDVVAAALEQVTGSGEMERILDAVDGPEVQAEGAPAGGGLEEALADVEAGAGPDEATDLTADPSQPPSVTEEIVGLGALAQQAFAGGITMEELATLLAEARGAAGRIGKQLGPMAADALFRAVNAEGTAYTIGKGLGFIAGNLLVEVILAIVTYGGSTLISGAKAALTAVRASSKLAGAIRVVDRVVKPVLDLVVYLKRTLGSASGAVKRWLDAALAWMRGIVRRFLPNSGVRAWIDDALDAGRRGWQRLKQATRKAKKAVAMAVAKIASDALERAGFRHGAALTALRLLRVPFRFIEDFRADSLGPRLYTMKLVASPGTPFDVYKDPTIKALMDELELTSAQKSHFLEALRKIKEAEGKIDIDEIRRFLKGYPGDIGEAIDDFIIIINEQMSAKGIFNHAARLISTAEEGSESGIQALDWARKHVLVGTEKHHAVFRYLLRALEKAGYPVKRKGRMVSQKLVELPTNIHRELHEFFDNMAKRAGRYDLSRRRGASDQIAVLLNDKKITPNLIFYKLKQISKKVLADHEDEQIKVLTEIDRIRNLLGL